MRQCPRLPLHNVAQAIDGDVVTVNQAPAAMPTPIDPRDLWLTLAALCASIAVGALMVWLERRPRTDLSPRLLPTTPILLGAALIGLLALVHLVNLYGIHTGRGP